jgi:uncharacterized membrane protein YdjX (TVP38/TMEM64 family)
LSEAPNAPSAEQAAGAGTTASPSRARFIRLGLLAAVLVGLYVVGHVTGVTERIDVRAVRDTVEDAGALGVLVFWVVFALGELLHVPGIVFVVSGLLVWGQLVGLPVAYVGAIGSMCASFYVVRSVGGRALAGVERPWIRRTLAKLEENPIRTVIILRFVLFLAPQLNYALALTNLRFRDYVIGSAIGIAPHIVAVTFLLDWVIRFFELA